MESRLRQIRITKPSSPVWLVTEAFVTKWNQRIPKIRRWQFMWNASNGRSSAFKTVHVHFHQYIAFIVGRVYTDYAAARCLFVCLSVCHTPVIHIPSVPSVFGGVPNFDAGATIATRRLPEATPAHSALRLAVDARTGGKPDIRSEWKRQRGRPSVG